MIREAVLENDLKQNTEPTRKWMHDTASDRQFGT
jgi:hypothetical protein